MVLMTPATTVLTQRAVTDDLPFCSDVYCCSAETCPSSR